MTELTTAGQKAVADGAKAADAVERQMLFKGCQLKRPSFFASCSNAAPLA